jgi:hypothetical protein
MSSDLLSMNWIASLDLATSLASLRNTKGDRAEPVEATDNVGEGGHDVELSACLRFFWGVVGGGLFACGTDFEGTAGGAMVSAALFAGGELFAGGDDGNNSFRAPFALAFSVGTCASTSRRADVLNKRT